MKIALFMIMCSALANECMPPHKLGQYDTLYECLNAGYTESLNKSKELGKEEVNKHEIYLKFVCTPEKAEGVST
jgi:hypothetical protein|tara:strand:+ start:62 stop:283 length:222 start_codon:yes stop_codon:yes gene_type:complete